MVGPHIKLLSRISRLMNNEDFRRRLLEAGSPKELLEIFRKEEATHFEA
jgi:mannitol/fructose-specific phosphotransferase system IIA component (Ntr-type)